MPAIAMPFEPVGSAGGPPASATGGRSGAEAQRHPRFELLDDPRLHVGMRRQVEVEAVGPRIHQGLEPLRALAVLHLHVGGVDEELHAEVAIDLLFAFRFGQPALRIDEVGLDAIEVVFGLRVHEAKHHVRIGLAVDMRDAPVVANNRDALGALLPGGDFRTDLCRLRLG
jgi:hypothetical protein